MDNLTQRVEAMEDSIKMAGLATKEVLTFDEASIFTGLSKSYLYKLTSGQKIPHFKPAGKMVYFSRQELEAWLLQNRISTIDEIAGKAQTYCMTNKKGGRR